MPLKAQEQGFKGKKVQHKDGETATGDWQKEFGPKGPQAPKETPKEKKPCKKAGGLVQRLNQARGHREPPSLADPMPLKAQEQGFKGKKVQHKDGETATGDWQKEFGPKGPQAPKETPKEKKPCKNATGLVEWGRREAPNLADPMPLKAQEQGFKGKKVQHKDGETATGDWQKEFGPKGPQAPTEAPKEKKPCKKTGSFVQAEKSASTLPSAVGFVTAAVLATLF